MPRIFSGQGLVVVGAQWGDEGKGRIVDTLAQDCDVIVRFQGGNNAGHSLHIGDQSLVLHLIPCGIMRQGKMTVIGNGVVLDPSVLFGEFDLLARYG
ncbi:MAG TPA: adenylosuccinate synthetase, partial [Myxococcota bacterium]|nr:adenylosuccinate synthetase [Myxococcota bacterium]